MSTVEPKKCEFCGTPCVYVIFTSIETNEDIYHEWECPYCEISWIIPQGEELVQTTPVISRCKDT